MIMHRSQYEKICLYGRLNYFTRGEFELLLGRRKKLQGLIKSKYINILILTD